MIRPPMTAIASGCCICAPGPKPAASGTSPRIVHKLVIKIGRNRVRPALRRASRSGIPSLPELADVLDQDDAILDVQVPIKRITPMNEETLSGVPVIHRAKKRAGQRDRLGEKYQERERFRLWNWKKPRSRNTECRRYDQDRRQAGELDSC